MHASALSGLAAAMALATRAPYNLHSMCHNFWPFTYLLNASRTIECPVKIQCVMPSSSECLLDAVPSIIACEFADAVISSERSSRHSDAAKHYGD